EPAARAGHRDRDRPRAALRRRAPGRGGDRPAAAGPGDEGGPQALPARRGRGADGYRLSARQAEKRRSRGRLMPLSGIRVVDLTRILAGPFCTQLLADLGAEVIKVEPPGRGDPVRGQGAIKNGLSWYYAQFNRNKKSITLDLYADAGKAVLADLLRGADVLVENYRPGVLAKMGFDEARLGESNP